MTKKYEKTQVTGPSLLNSNGVIAGPSPGASLKHSRQVRILCNSSPPTAAGATAAGQNYESENDRPMSRTETKTRTRGLRPPT